MNGDLRGEGNTHVLNHWLSEFVNILWLLTRSVGVCFVIVVDETAKKIVQTKVQSYVTFHYVTKHQEQLAAFIMGIEMYSAVSFK
jgi:hypothetical protein